MCECGEGGARREGAERAIGNCDESEHKRRRGVRRRRGHSFPLPLSLFYFSSLLLSYFNLFFSLPSPFVSFSLSLSSSFPSQRSILPRLIASRPLCHPRHQHPAHQHHSHRRYSNLEPQYTPGEFHFWRHQEKEEKQRKKTTQRQCEDLIESIDSDECERGTSDDREKRRSRKVFQHEITIYRCESLQNSWKRASVQHVLFFSFSVNYGSHCCASLSGSRCDLPDQKFAKMVIANAS